MRWFTQLGIVKVHFYCGTSLGGLIDCGFLIILKGLEINWFTQIRFIVGANFAGSPLLEPNILLVFLFYFPWYKKNAQN